jgi:hypothetical protein
MDTIGGMPFRQSVIPALLFASIPSFASLHRLRHWFDIIGSTSLVQHH